MTRLGQVGFAPTEPSRRVLSSCVLRYRSTGLGRVRALRDKTQCPVWFASICHATRTIAPSPIPRPGLRPARPGRKAADLERRAAPANWADQTRGTARLAGGVRAP